MWTNHGDPFAGPLVSSNVAVRVLFVFLLLSTNRCNAGKLLRWRCLQCLEDSTSNVWSNLCQSDVPDDGKCCHSPSFAVRQGSQTLPWLRTARDGGRRCTNLYDYLHIHTYTQNHSHAHTHIHADAQEHMHRHPNRQILRHRDTYTVLLSCNTITCTEHMRVQIHLHVPLKVPQLYLHIELNWHIESMCTCVCIYVSIHMRDI